MSSLDFLKRLAALLLAAVAVALLLRLAGGRAAFTFYGPAFAAVLTLPLVHRLLANRLAEIGRSRRWALLYTIPVGTAAVLQIGYWLAFFHGSASTAVGLGVLRQYLRDYHVAQGFAGVLVLALAFLAFKLVGGAAEK